MHTRPTAALRTLTLVLGLLAMATTAQAQVPDGTFASGLTSPDNIIQLADGRILVAEYAFDGAGQITAFSPDGTPLGAFATGLDAAFGMAELADGRILVGNPSYSDVDSEVLAFAQDGTFLGVFATVSTSPSVHSFVSLIEQLDDGTILVADQAQNAVFRYDTSGTLLGTFASGISGAYGTHQLPDGSVLVAAHASGTIERFDSDGTFLGTFAAGLSAPNVITPLDDGTLLVAEAGSGDFEQFETDGTPLGTFATGLNSPYGVVQLADTRVLFSDYGNGTVLYFNADHGYDITMIPVDGSGNPIGQPVAVPAGGGTVSYQATLTNNTADPIGTQVWLGVRFPDGTLVVKRRAQPVTLQPGTPLGFQGGFQLFPAFPDGTYTFYGYTGTHPDGARTFHEITIEKASARSGAPAMTTAEILALDPDAFLSFGDEALSTTTTAEVPTTTALGSAYPNPFNPSATVPFTLAEAAAVRLAVYDVLGREVAVLVDGRVEAGHHAVRFEARDLPSGTYLVRFAAGGHTHTQRVTLAK